MSIQFSFPWLLPFFLAIATIIVWKISNSKAKSLLLIRILLLFLLFLPFSFPTFKSQTISKTTIVLLDYSQSIRYVHKKLNIDLEKIYLEKLQEIQQQLAPNDSLGAVWFANEMQIAAPLSKKQKELKLFPPRISDKSSDLKLAIKKAMTIFPKENHKRIIVFTDGFIPNIKDTVSFIKKSNIEFYCQYGPFGTLDVFKDVAITALSLPPLTTKGSYVSGNLNIYTTGFARVEINLYANKKIFYKEKVVLPKIGNFAFPFAVFIEKNTIVSATVTSQQIDQCTINNSFAAMVEVKGNNRVLVIGKNPFILKNLQITEVKASQVKPANFKKYSLIVLVDGNAKTLQPFLPSLIEYISLGGSFLMMGNYSTYGMGGFSGTILEKTLPLWCTPQKKESLSLFVVLDTSGSMEDLWQKEKKLQLAKKALLKLVSHMKNNDYVSLLTFNNYFKWQFTVSSIAPLKDKLTTILGKIFPQGNTYIFPALKEAWEKAQESPYKKHILLLSDGISPGENEKLIALAKQINKTPITLSTIATGGDAEILKKIAIMGKGRFYRIAEQSLSSLLIQDVLWAKSPVLNSKGGILKKIANRHIQIPSSCEGLKIGTYALTSKKSWGENLLTTTKNHPILAIAQFSLGKTACFTSNFSREWGKELNKEQGMKALMGVIQWLLPQKKHVTPSIKKEGKYLSIRLDSFKGKLQLKGNWLAKAHPFVSSADASLIRLPMPETKRILRMAIQNNAGENLASFQYIIPYDQEYAFLGNNKSKIFDYIPTKKQQQDKDIFGGIIICALFLFLLERILTFYQKN